ncbi:uncharacterized protein FA14DRAFT_190617 [Meira miltonrushii]|uniref:Uncharacterized protein n=1 Tax=Meira miltonrushii TaxID=1280837 RepID=A0A316V8V3_9BASI|nr:uncharacterized protein FA14DRAFT_190617 [Meira miltonrushii]PWN33468.1 hypothetical protein FA14DRAFT_190617 [Meira miltonrushii]
MAKISSREASTSNHLPTSASLITLPIPSPHAPTHLVAHITQFKGHSLMLWCGEANPSLADAALQDERQSSNQAAQQAGSSSLLMEEHVAPGLQTNAHPDSIPPTGLLGKEWAVGMTNPATDASMSTSLFRSNLDIAKPMAARLSKRFKIPQLFLSLALPDQLLSMLDGPFSEPLGGKALLLLEGALGKVIKSNAELQSTTAQ